MPKKFADVKKGKWLKLYEEGKTEKWIAAHTKCDQRTVRKAINDAQMKRDVAVARVELVKDALRKHQDSLLEELDGILSGLVVPYKDLDVLSWKHERDSVFSEPDDKAKPESGGDNTMRRLLKEHLKNDKLWRVLAQWQKANASQMAAREALQRKTAALLKEKTGFELVDSNDDSPPFVYSYTAGPLFYKTAIDIAFAPSEEKDMEEAIRSLDTGITVDIDNGYVKFGRGQVLAVAPGREQETKQNLLNALRELAGAPEVKAVVETYQPLEQITAKTRQVAESVKLLGLVPGQCEICRRLGM